MRDYFNCQVFSRCSTLVETECVYCAVQSWGCNSYANTSVNLFAFSLSALIGSVHVICVEAEGFIVAHQVIVVVWDREQVWVYQHPRVVDIEGGEHLADVWDLDLALVKRVLFFHEKDTVGDGSVGVFVWVVIETDHVALGDEVEEDGGEEGEEADHATESGLQCEALYAESGLQEDLGHEEEAGPAGAVGEHLHP